MNDAAPSIEQDPRWTAVTTRDASADGAFFYSVRTTGVYCRPSCPSRAPNPKNVAFHLSAADARAAGFRACLRCKPDEPSQAERHAALAALACRRIEAAEETPSLAALAREAGLSPHHFHRLFKAAVGLTPHDYAAARKAGRLRQELAAGGSVTQAMFEAGYSSSSRLYEQSEALLGMTPSAFRDGAPGAGIAFAIGQSSLGAILVARSDKGVCAILMGDDPGALLRDLQDRFPKARLTGGDEDVNALVARVVGLIEAPGLGLDLPLDVRGTAFQRRVWRALQDIPPGRTVSYAEIAKAIGSPKSVRAVAGACAANAIAVAIPCHRVVRSDGSLSGYRWGVARKSALLARERASN